MKIKAFALIMAILCLATVFVGCEDTETCNSHVDENKDGKCDVCGTAVACAEHVDENKDGKCDVCGTEVACAEHVDADKDGKCDVCDADMPQKPVCETHTDVDADGYCDACGGAIVVIYQKVEPVNEERIPMVVSGIPSDASAFDYIVTTVNELVAFKNFEKSDKDFTALNKVANRNLVMSDIPAKDTESGATMYHTYIIYDAITSDVIYTNSTQHTGDASGATKSVVINTGDDYYFDVTVTVTEPQNEADTIVTKSYEVYTYGGEKLYSIQWKSNNEDGKSWDDVKVTPSKNVENNITYVTVGNEVFAFDENTKEYLGFKLDKVALVYRPTFETVVGNYGYIEYDEKLFIYDLTKWIDCIYSVDIDDDAWFILSNGNVLVEREFELAYDAASYDYVKNGKKYDIVHELVDVAAKTSCDVEFGYSVAKVEFGNEIDGLYNNKVDNVFTVYPVVRDNLSTVAITVAVSNELSEDNKLQIVCDVTDVKDWIAIGSNLFLVEEHYDDDTSAQKIVHKTGKLVAYVPEGAEIKDNYIKYDGNYYDLEMKLIIDCSEYTVETIKDTYAILSKTTEYEADGQTTVSVKNYYYYKLGAAEPKMLVYYNSIDYYDWGFSVRFEHRDAEGNTSYSRTLYGTDGNVLHDIGSGSVQRSEKLGDGYAVKIRTVTNVDGVSNTTDQWCIIK